MNVGGRRLAYEEVTADDPRRTVLLLCGIGAKREGWYKQMPVLGRHFRALALDYRDVGDSDPAREAYSIRELADDVYALAGGLGIARASLVGISMGGFIALEFALAYPEFVDRLALVVTSTGGATHVSTSSEVMRALMPGDEEVESGGGALHARPRAMAELGGHRPALRAVAGLQPHRRQQPRDRLRDPSCAQEQGDRHQVVAAARARRRRRASRRRSRPT